jgi:hypothetical protein
MRGPEFLIPIFFFLSVGAVWAVFLLTRHRERTMMIEKGMQSEEIKAMYARRWFTVNPLTTLKWGMLFVGVGLAALVGIWLRENYILNDGVIPGLMAIFGGAALIFFYFIARHKEN